MQSPTGECTQVWLSSCVCIFTPWVATLEVIFTSICMDQLAPRDFIANFPNASGHPSFVFSNTKITGRTTSPHHTRQQSEGEGGGPPSAKNAIALLQVSFQSPSQVFVSVAENGPLSRPLLLGPFLNPGSPRGWGRGGVKCSLGI